MLTLDKEAWITNKRSFNYTLPNWRLFECHHDSQLALTPPYETPEMWQSWDRKTSPENFRLTSRHHILTSTRNEANHKHIPRTGKHIPRTGNIFLAAFPREPRKPCGASNWSEANHERTGPTGVCCLPENKVPSICKVDSIWRRYNKSEIKERWRPCPYSLFRICCYYEAATVAPSLPQ